MRWHFLTGSVFVACCSLLNDGDFLQRQLPAKKLNNYQPASISDFTVSRLSGERVMIKWHTEGEVQPVRFEVMRKQGSRQVFVSLGTVAPKLEEETFADYAFIDTNNYKDSSFYCLKKTTADSVVFFSLPKGVAGISKKR